MQLNVVYPHPLEEIMTECYDFRICKHTVCSEVLYSELMEFPESAGLWLFISETRCVVIVFGRLSLCVLVIFNKCSDCR